MITCETVTITVEDEAGNRQTAIVPAYTRSFDDMKVQLNDLVENYLERSKEECQPMSLGDFAMFAITKSASDPREIG